MVESRAIAINTGVFDSPLLPYQMLMDPMHRGQNEAMTLQFASETRQLGYFSTGHLMRWCRSCLAHLAWPTDEVGEPQPARPPAKHSEYLAHFVLMFQYPLE